MKRQSRFVLQTVAIAVMSSMLGFCYSIVTQSESHASAVSVAPRLVGTSTLRFLNAVYAPTPTDFDLGDALLGTVITRYLTATGGIRPYVFSSADIDTTLGANSNLTVFSSGVVMGSASIATIPTAVTFIAKVTDSTESNIQQTAPPTSSQNFHLTLFPSAASVFRFAVDSLNNGVLGQAYFSKADTIGGKPTITISVVPGSVTLNGVQVGTGSSLEETVGLTMASDGTVFGRPLSTGLVTFTAHATDSRRHVANDRTNSVPDQVLSFNIEDSQITATDNMVLALNVRGDTGQFNTDTLKFQTFLNMSGLNISGLSGGKFAFIFGGKTYDGGYINRAGVVGDGLGKNYVIYPDGTLLQAKVNSVNGTIIGSLSRANLSAGLNAANLLNRTTVRVPAAVLVNNIVIASDSLDMQVTHLTTKYQLDYNVGLLGNSLGGTFQIFDVRGSDKSDIAGNAGDAWITKFLIAPRFGVDDTAGYSGLNAIRVRIGTNFVQTIPVATSTTAGITVSPTGTIVYKGVGKGASVSTMQISPTSFSGEIITNPLSESTTGLPTSKDTAFATTNFFNLAIDVLRNAPNASYSGEDGKFIFKAPAVKAWLDRNTKRPGLSGF